MVTLNTMKMSINKAMNNRLVVTPKGIYGVGSSIEGSSEIQVRSIKGENLSLRPEKVSSSAFTDKMNRKLVNMNSLILGQSVSMIVMRLNSIKLHYVTLVKISNDKMTFKSGNFSFDVNKDESISLVSEKDEFSIRAFVN